MDLIIRIANLGGSRRQNEIGSRQCIDHIGCAKMISVQFSGVDIHHHLPKLAAEGVRDLHPFQSAHFVSDGVISDRVKLRFAQPFTRDRRQHHRQVRRFTAQRKRPLNPRRQVKHVTRLEVYDVIHRGACVRTGLEEDLDDCGTRNGARFLVFDFSGKCQCAFDASRHRLFHIQSWQAWIRKETDNNRFFEIRKNIDLDTRNNGRP